MYPIISVIVPVYNATMYLHQCVDSILSQILKDIEIILVDDGSTDNSGNICDEYESLDSRIFVIHKQNEGLVNARKSGLKVAHGKYIGYVDADDWIEPDMYEKMLKEALETEADLVVCNRFLEMGQHSTVMRNSLKPGIYDEMSIRSDITPFLLENKDFFCWGIYPSQCDKLFKREYLVPTQENVPNKIKIGEDTCCVLPYILKAHKIVLMDECFYHYRQHPLSMVKVNPNSKEDVERFTALCKYLNDIAKESKAFEVLEHQIRDYLLFIMIPRLHYLLPYYLQQETLIPFTGISKNSRVVIYGAGVYGQSLYNFLSDTHFCEITAWVDTNWETWKDSGLPVDAPETILSLEYDYIAVAVMSLLPQQNIKDNLLSLGCSQECIKCVDMDYIRSDEFWRELFSKK